MKRPFLRRSWILLLMFLILVVGFSITSLLGYRVTRDYIVKSAISETLPLISDNIYSAIKEELIDPINVSSLMSNDTFLMNWVVDGEQDLDAISEYLSFIKQEYQYTSSFFVSDRTGNYYYYDGILKQVSSEDAHDIWYFDFKELNAPYVLDIDNDQAKEDTLTVFINHRLESKDGTFLGVTGVGLEVNDIGARLLKYQEIFDHKIYMTDAKGLIQIHYDELLVETTKIGDLEGIAELNDAILASYENVQIFEYQDSTGDKAISVRYIPEFDWFLIVEKDQDASLLAARRSLLNNIVIGLGITAILSVLIMGLFKGSNRRLEKMATYDELTQLYNRSVVSIMIKKEISVSKRYNVPLSLLMIDIDEFKTVNDRFGHPQGDLVLKEISAAIKNNVRESDLVGRWGGDEFVVLLPRTGDQEAYQSAKRILNSVETLVFEVGENQINKTVSIGLATLNDPGSSWSDLIQKADEALMIAKQHGKNRISGSIDAVS
jgi:diguanylate cyclase (GGDEF)-like protein